MSYDRLLTLNDVIAIHKEHTPESLRSEFNGIIEEMSDNMERETAEWDMYWDMTYGDNEAENLLDLI